MREDVPEELLQKRRREKQAGVKSNRRKRERVWRDAYRPALPSGIMGNLCSMGNKMEELETLIRSQSLLGKQPHV